MYRVHTDAFTCMPPQFRASHGLERLLHDAAALTDAHERKAAGDVLHSVVKATYYAAARRASEQRTPAGAAQAAAREAQAVRAYAEKFAAPPPTAESMRRDVKLGEHRKRMAMGGASSSSANRPPLLSMATAAQHTLMSTAAIASERLVCTGVALAPTSEREASMLRALYSRSLLSYTAMAVSVPSYLSCVPREAVDGAGTTGGGGRGHLWSASPKNYKFLALLGRSITRADCVNVLNALGAERVEHVVVFCTEFRVFARASLCESSTAPSTMARYAVFAANVRGGGGGGALREDALLRRDAEDMQDATLIADAANATAALVASRLRETPADGLNVYLTSCGAPSATVFEWRAQLCDLARQMAE